MTPSQVAYARPALALTILFVSWLFGTLYLGIIHRLTIPTGLMYQASWWGLGSQSVLATAVIVAALTGASLVQASALYGFAQFGMGIALAAYVRRKLPQFFPTLRDASLRRGVGDLLRSSPQILSGVAQQGAANGVVVLISAISGAAAVPVFTTIRTLSNLWTNVTNLLTSPLLPDLVRFHAKREGEKLLAIYEIHGVVIVGLVNLSIMIAYPLIPYFYPRWTSHSLLLDVPLLCAMLGTVSLFNLGSLMSTLLMGINHQLTILATTFARGVIALFLGAYLLSKMGVSGLGFALWVAELVALFLYGYFFLNNLGTISDVHRVWERFSYPVLGVVSLNAFLFAEAFGLPARPFMQTGALLCICASAYLGWLRLSPDVQERLWHLVSRNRGAE